MPNWRKVIVSGSSAQLNHITASGDISGSSTSTGSFGVIEVGGGHFTSASLASGGTTTLDSATVSGSWRGALSGSLNLISGSSISTGSFGVIEVDGVTLLQHHLQKAVVEQDFRSPVQQLLLVQCLSVVVQLQ